MREEFNFDYNWKFSKAESIKGEKAEDYFGMFSNNTKTGAMIGCASIGFDDNNWEPVDLPHDWCAYENFAESNESPGYKPSGEVWYRKTFSLDGSLSGKSIFLVFDGIAINSRIYLNNILIKKSDSGYTPIICEITDFVTTNAPNTIAVYCDNRVKEGWWYEGGGIYRHARIIVTEKTHFNNYGIFVFADTDTKDYINWSLKISADICSEEEELVFEARIKELDFCVSGNVRYGKAEAIGNIVNPTVWNLENPYLYTVECLIKKNYEILDCETVNIGIRKAEFTTENGFLLNGDPIKIKGVCLHHDFGGVGVAVPDTLIEYKLLKLKEMGCNAIRTSHNPQAPEFYDVCDKLGILVMDETRHFSSVDEELKNLELFIRRDRNHPCVVLWSLFNEEPLQCTSTGEKMIASMKKLVNRIDGSRCISGGMNGTFENRGVIKSVDVIGFNYLQYGYEHFHSLFPDIPIIGSETGSYLSTRGIDKTVKEDSHISRFGNILYENLYPWSSTPGDTWKAIADKKYVCGGFYWTGADYYGESGPYDWPGVTSNFGAIDVCCFEKDNFYWHKALWNDKYTIKMMPHWSFRKEENVDVICYSNCEEFTISINGNEIKRFANDRFSPQILSLPFKKGSITAIGLCNGYEVCRETIFTGSGFEKIELSANKMQFTANTKDAVIVNIAATDKNGIIDPYCDDIITVNVENGNILGIANGDNACRYNCKKNKVSFFCGLAQVIVGSNHKGTVIVTAESGDKQSKVSLFAEKSCEKRIDSVDNLIFLQKIQMSDISDKHPDSNQVQNMYYAWIPTTIGYGRNLMYSYKDGYGTVCAKLGKACNGKVLYVEKVLGICEIYINGKLKATKSQYDIGDICVPIQNIGNEGTVGIVFNINKKECGFFGKAYVK